MTKKMKPAARLTASLEMGLGTPASEVDALDVLLADLGVPNAAEVIEGETDAIIGETTIEAAHEPAEVIEGEEVVDTAAADKAAAKVVADADKAAKKEAAVAEKKVAAEKKAADAAAAKVVREAEKAAKKAEREAAKAAKPASVPRVFFASKNARIEAHLGEKLGDYTVLTLSDAALTGDDLKAKQQETMDAIKVAGVKVQNRATLLIEFVAEKSSKLNEVISRALTLLFKDGKIKTGDKGNLHLNLLSKPYSPAAARAMGNNTVAALKLFKMIQKNEAGEYVANPESLMLMKANGLLGLS